MKNEDYMPRGARKKLKKFLKAHGLSENSVSIGFSGENDPDLDDTKLDLENMLEGNFVLTKRR